MNLHFKLFGSLFILILCFQNCSQINSDSTARDTSFKSENNGGSYGGKPSGTFYRFAAEFSCESGEAPSAFIEVRETTIRLTENRGQQCSAVTQDLRLQDLDTSIYQTDLIGYREGIYEGLESTPRTIPANLVEVWCRDRNDAEGIESIMHYDRQLQKSVNRIYYSQNESSGVYTSHTVADFPVARVITNQMILIRDESGFEIKVNRDQPAPQYGLFKGQFSALINGQKVIRETYCRLGGSLDPNVWPAKQVTEPGVYPQNLGVSPDGNYLAFMSAAPNRNIYLAKTDGTFPYQINPVDSEPSILGGGLPQAIFSADSKSLVFDASLNSPSYDRFLFEWNFAEPANGSARKLSLENQKMNSFAWSGNRKYLIYEYDLNQAYTFASRLKAIDLTGGDSFLLTPLAASAQVKGVISGFGVSRTQNKVAYLWDSGSDILELYSVNSDGTGRINISPRLPSSEWKLIGWDSAASVPNGGDYAMVKAIKGLESRFYAVALDGSGSSEIPSGWTWSLASPSGQFGLINPVEATDSTTKALLMNFKTGQSVPLPPLQTFNTDGYDGQGLGNSSINLPMTVETTTQIDKRSVNHPSLIFTSDSKALIGRTPVATGGFSAISVSTTDGKVQELCPGLIGQDLWIQPSPPNQILIATYNLKNRFLEVYLYQSDLGCRKVNSLLTPNSNLEAVREVTISPDQRKILVRVIKKVSDREITTQIFYVPLNGKPAYQVNYPLTESAEASAAVFAGNSKKVIFLANQATGRELSVFIWNVPSD